MVARLGAVCAAWVFLAALAHADDELDLSGNVRSIPVLVDSGRLGLGQEDDHSTAVQTLLRMIAEDRRGERWSWEAHLVQSHTWRSADPTSGAGDRLAGGRLRYRALDLTWDWWTAGGPAADPGDRNSASLWLDRANARLSLPSADVTIGRQAITFGKAYFWNPLDVFLPFDPNQFDRDYKAGVDALRVDLPRGDFSGVTLVAAWGREIAVDGVRPTGTYVCGDRFADVSWYGSAVLGRYFTNFRGWDVAVQGGKIYGGYQLGGALVGELGPLEIRAEGAYLWALDSDRPLPAPFEGEQLIEDHLALVLGGGHTFPSSFFFQVEHFVNGAGDPDDLAKALLRLETGAALNLGRHVTGLVAGYDLTPLVRGQLAALYSWSDGSFQLQPLVTVSLADNADLLFGVNLNHGERPVVGPEGIELMSEFGSFPNVLFSEVKFYF